MKKEFKNMPLANFASGTASISSGYLSTLTSQTIPASIGSVSASLNTGSPSLSATGGISESRGFSDQYEDKSCHLATGTKIDYFVFEIKLDLFEKLDVKKVKKIESIAKLNFHEFLRYSHVQFLIY